MPSIYSIKPAFQNLLRPMTRWLADHGISANQVTVSALLLSLLTGLVIAVSHQQTQIFFLIPVLLLVRMALNAIDGMLAREHGMKSPLGAILNELCDVISDVALYLPFALLPGVSIWLVVFVVISSIITELTGIIGIQIGASRRYDGPMGKSDRAFIFGAIALALAFGLSPAPWRNGLLCIILLLTVVTSFNRARQALAEINS